MKYDEHVRERLLAVLDAKNISATALGEAIGLSQQSVSAYLTGNVKHWKPERVRAAEQFLGESLLPPELGGASAGPRMDPQAAYQAETRRLSGNGGAVRLVPVIDIRLFPRGASEEKILDEILQRPHTMHETSSRDPRAFFLIIDEKAGRRGEPGDNALVLPSSPPIEGQLAAVETPRENPTETKVGKWVVVSGKPVVMMASGRVIEDFRLLGAVFELAIRAE